MKALQSTPKTTPCRRVRPQSLKSLRSVPYSSRQQKESRPETPPTPTPGQKRRHVVDPRDLDHEDLPSLSILNTSQSPPHLHSRQLSQDADSTPSSSVFPTIGTEHKEQFTRGPLRQDSDPMPFDLYNHDTKRYRHPTTEEAASILKHFPQAKELVFRYPILVLGCPQPPPITPLTIGGVPAVFVPKVSDFVMCPGIPGNPRVKDPLSREQAASPTWTMLEFVYRVFEQYNPQVVGTCFRNVVIELLNDVAIEQLPGVVGGRVAYYAVGGTKLEDCRNGRVRLLQPSDGVRDCTNYLADGLCPGVFVEGAKRGTSAGCLLQRDTVQRLSVANHGFEESEINVYHPLYNTNIIARIDERWRHLDIALCQMLPNVDFTNTDYFDAPIPQSLLHSDTVSDYESWCWVDGATTGAIPFLRCGLAYVLPGAPNGTYHQLKHYRGYNLKVFGPVVGDVSQGLCGAPVVTEEDEMGGVLGFFSFSLGDMIYVHALDDLVAAGWRLANG